MKRINMLESLSDNILIDKDKCVFCGICVERCILDNLRMKLSPCSHACPLGVNCQGYIQSIARGEEAKGMQLLREALPFPGILGRVCSQPCEERCHRKEIEGAPVAIRALKRYLADLEGEAEAPLPAIAPPSGKTVAVVGSGPAGMMAAHDLRVRGHEVTVFDAAGAPGGMLRWAIPEFRLPAEVLEKEIDLLYRMGIVFKCGVALGAEKSMEDLKSDFEAVIVATGCPAHLKLGAEGEDRPGIHHGLPFLRSVREGKHPEIGKAVVVIGGGNVAVDAAQTALRSGAETVTLVTLESDESLPAFPWALQSAVSEGVRLECSWGNPSFSFRDGVLKGVALQRCLQVFDACGDFKPRFDACESNYLGADTVIVAIGQKVDLSTLEKCGLAANGSVAADALTLQTADEKVFIAGDISGGPSTVVEAMAKGRRAAESVDRFLKKEHLRYGREYPGPIETDFDIDTRKAAATPRAEIPRHRFGGKGDFREIEQALNAETARGEALRCYSCGQPFGKYRSCWFCLPCEVDCPTEAIRVDIPYLLK